MPNDLPIRCSCGTVKGIAHDISGKSINRVICYCDDCQSFAHFLGRADDILDAHGGTDIFQMSPRCFEITDGIDHLACMRLTPKGLLRWYADCCNTPIGNTLPTRQIPFLGVVHNGCINPSPDDAALGPIRGHVHGRFAKGAPAIATKLDRGLLFMFLRFAAKILIWRLHGDHKHSPFFDARTGDPIVRPRILSADELRDVENTRDGYQIAGP